MTLDQLRERWGGEIQRLARIHGARNVRVFGSLARGQGTSASDLDLLVDFAPECSLLDLIGLEQELGDALGMKIDVVTEDGLSPYLRDDILKQAVSL